MRPATCRWRSTRSACRSGIGKRMIWWTWAIGSWETMANLVEDMICHLAETLFGGLRIVHHRGTEGTEKIIDLKRPWHRVRMVDLVEERTGWRFDKRPLQE